MPEPLPPFSGDEPPCPKCSNEGAITYYRPAGTPPNYPDSQVPEHLPERLDRACSRCGFEWAEALNPPREQPGPSDSESPYFSQLPSSD